MVTSSLGLSHESALTIRALHSRMRRHMIPQKTLVLTEVISRCGAVEQTVVIVCD
jgi:hypothetical protein